MRSAGPQHAKVTRVLIIVSAGKAIKRFNDSRRWTDASSKQYRVADQSIGKITHRSSSGGVFEPACGTPQAGFFLCLTEPRSSEDL